RVAAARHRVELVAACEPPAAWRQEQLALAEPAEPFERDEGGRWDPGRAVDLERDTHVLSLEHVSAGQQAPHVHRLRGEADPRPAEQRRERQSDGDGVQRLRAEDPRDDVDGEAEEKGQAAAIRHLRRRYTGTGVLSSAA